MHPGTFEDRELKVGIASPLDTMARLNPVACVRYVDALLTELDDTMTHGAMGDASAPWVDAYRQIHALKNAVAATGCPVLIEACGSLQAGAAEGMDRSAVRSAFLDIARATRRLILTYRDGGAGPG